MMTFPRQDPKTCKGCGILSPQDRGKIRALSGQDIHRGRVTGGKIWVPVMVPGAFLVPEVQGVYRRTV